LGDLVCFEELTDYKLVNSSKVGKEKGKKRKSDSISEEVEEDSTIQEKKRKKYKELGTRANKNYKLKEEQDVTDQEDKPKDTTKLFDYEEDECELGGSTTTEKT
uniref:Uncharacterized protein n=2 Tax=Gopherus TaxID=38771 RepID=A0A452GR46_9SAUR